MTASDVVAIYAAVVATVALGWNVVDQLWSRRVRLKVSISVGTMHRPWVVDGVGGGPVPVVIFEARNVGRVPILLERCGLSVKREPVHHRLDATDHPVHGTSTLPAAVPSHGNFRLTVLARDFPATPSGFSLEQFEYAYFEDQIGRYYFARTPTGFAAELGEAAGS